MPHPHFTRFPAAVRVKKVKTKALRRDEERDAEISKWGIDRFYIKKNTPLYRGDLWDAHWSTVYQENKQKFLLPDSIEVLRPNFIPKSQPVVCYLAVFSLFYVN